MEIFGKNIYLKNMPVIINKGRIYNSTPLPLIVTYFSSYLLRYCISYMYINL